jgi:hypothetical protein
MPEAVYQVTAMLSTLVAPLPIGTNLGLLHLLWMLVSGRLLGSRGAILPGLSELGLTDGEVRRAWAALGGAWTSDELITRWTRQAEGAGHWQPHQYGGYRPVALDLTGFWRPRLQGCPTRHYHAEAGRALPAIVIGIIARVGSAAGQRLGLPLGLVRAEPSDPSPAAHRRRLIAVAAERRAADEVLVGDREFRIADFQAAGVPAWVARLPKNFTARRATPPPSGGRGRPATRGRVVRPLPRRRQERRLAATPPDQVTTWTEDTTVVRAEVWADLVLSDAAPGSPTCTVVAVHQPDYQQPLLLGTPLALAPEQVRAVYRDRWPVEQLPLAAKQLVGAARQFVHAPETCQRLPELALLAGSILSSAAATLPATPTGYWDRQPRPTPGRLRRVLARGHFPQAVPLPPRLRQKASRTDHLPKGWFGQRRPAAAPIPTSSSDSEPAVEAA